MKKAFLFITALAMSAMMMAATGDLLCGGSFIGSFPNSETWIGSDVDYYSGNGYKFDQNETLQSPNLTAGVKKVKIRILVGHNGGATSTLTVGAFDSEGSQLSISENIVPTVAYTAQTDDAIQEFTLDGDGVSDIKYVLISFTKVKNYGMKTFEVYDATGTATVTLDSIVIRGEATKMEYKVGEAFDPAGLEVWGYYNKTVKHDSISQIKSSSINWTLDPETFEEVSDNASVTLVASYKDLTTADTTITGIKVTEKPAKITTIAGITSGKKYYIGATTGTPSSDFYFSVDGSVASETSVKGTAVTDVADAVALTFTAVTGGWTLRFENGNYLGLKNASDNGKVLVSEAPVVWTIDEDTDKGLLKLHPNDYYLQKNNSGTQFGSYKNTQTNVWLTPASEGPVTGIREAMVNANVRKAMVNGRLIIVKGEKAYDLQGRIVK